MTYVHAHLAAYRKALIAVTGALGQAVTLGMLHGTAQNVAQLVLAALTALGVYGVANSPTVAADGGDEGMTMLEVCWLIVAVSVAVLALVALGWLPR